MRLEDVLEAFEHKISGGDEYLWHSFPNARYIDFECDFGYGSVLYSTKDQTVYEASVHSKKDDCIPYRWFNIDFHEAYEEECAERGIDPAIAWDDVEWAYVEDEYEFIKIAESVFTDTFYSRETISLDAPKEDLFKWMLAAHVLDITLNAFVELALREALDRFEAEEERMQNPDVDWTDEQWEEFREWLVKRLKTNTTTVTFTKINKGERVMRCTLDPEQLPKAMPKKATKNASSETLAVYDLDKEAWRSFNLKSVTRVECES